MVDTISGSPPLYIDGCDTLGQGDTMFSTAGCSHPLLIPLPGQNSLSNSPFQFTSDYFWHSFGRCRVLWIVGGGNIEISEDALCCFVEHRPQKLTPPIGILVLLRRVAG